MSSVTPTSFWRPLSALRHPSEVVRHFTPNWFTMCMGTGILFLDLAAFPWGFPGQDGLVHLLWAADIALYAVFALIFLARWIFYYDSAQRLLLHPVQSMFLGAIPMGLVPIINGLVEFGPPILGQTAISIAHGLWWLDLGLGVLFAWLVPFYMFTHQEHSVENMTAVWLLPIVSPEVTASAGGILAPHLTPMAGQTVIYLSYILWALSVPLAMGILVILFLRLVWHKLPHRDMAVSSWLTLGPIGTGSLGLLVLGQAAPLAFANTPFVAEAALARNFGLIGGLILWGYGLWWLITAILITLRYLREGMPFNMGWWGFTFPLGVYDAATLVLHRLTGFMPFEIIGALLCLLLAFFWTVVTTRTLHGMWHGYLFRAPCLSEETGLPEAECRPGTERQED